MIFIFREAQHKKEYKCRLCHKSFSEKLVYLAHQEKHKKSSPLKCTVCRETFKHQASLDTHMKTHKTEKPFTCDKCGKRFKSNFALNMHTPSHASTEKTYKCKVYGEEFKQKTDLETQMGQHNTVYTCETCGEEFPDKSSLKKHRFIHTGEKLFACNFPGCSEFFTQKVRTYLRPLTALWFSFSIKTLKCILFLHSFCKCHTGFPLAL